MKLCIDVGNTAIKFALFKGDGIIRIEVIATNKNAKTGAYLSILNKFDSISQVCLSTVVPEVSDIIREDIKSVFNLSPLEISPGIKTGIKINATNAKEVGSDIVAMAVAANKKYSENKLIVSLGTASVFILMKKSTIEGVSIAPGINLSRNALASGASKLRITEFNIEKELFGKDTDSSINTGIIYSQAGAIDRMISNARRIMDNPTIIMTGGYKEIIAPHVSKEIILEKNLAIFGLKIIGDKNE